jgi:putative membrane protein
MIARLFSIPMLTVALVMAAGSQAANAEGPPGDAQIAHVAVTANQIDIDAAKIAQGKTKNADVKKFADLMVKDHGSVIKAATELAGKLKLTPEDNDTSKALMTGADQNVASLNKLSGADFDKAYVGHEVDYHKAVLDALDKVLIPNARNAELKSLLTSARPAFAQHLSHAEALQKKLAAAK